nr:EOG090X0KMN [Eulimnadia texana]
MENYTKGKNVEEPLEFENLPFRNISRDTPWIKVKASSKMTNLIGFALKTFRQDENKVVLWSGVGPAVSKMISCLEIVKRRIRNLHQITKISYVRSEEYWEPKLEGLDELKIVRNVPAVFALLSTQPLDSNEPGYQAPNSHDAFWKEDVPKPKPSKRRKNATNYARKATTSSRDPKQSEMKHLSEIHDQNPHNFPDNIQLVYSCKNAQDVLFKDEISEISRKIKQFKVQYYITRHSLDEDTINGKENDNLASVIKGSRITTADMDAILRKSKNNITDCFLCGPPPMIDNIVEILQSLNVPQKHIHYEKWW